MTIDSEWVKILKRSKPDAFFANLPQKCEAAFIDGQIKLNCGQNIITWKQFVEYQFVNPIKMFFGMGCHTVVLGFDNYDHVPTAKGPTQRIRNKCMPSIKVLEDDALPRVVPENFPSMMRNRVFKTKVILMVLNALEEVFKSESLVQAKRSLIFDYKNRPKILGVDITLPAFFSDIPDAEVLLRRGECDIKAFDWMFFENLLIDSVDGDYVPMGIIQQQTHARNGNNCHLVLRRLELNIETDKSKKRPRGRIYEFVDVPALCQYVESEFKSYENPALQFAAMCSLSGCDFTMNLPALGPTRLWQARVFLLKHQISFDSQNGILKAVICNYISLFQKHLNTRHEEVIFVNDTEGLMNIYKTMRDCIEKCPKISQRTKDRIWTDHRVLTHCKNVNWTMQYWTKLKEYPDPLEILEEGVSSKWGFVKQKNIVVFEEITN